MKLEVTEQDPEKLQASRALLEDIWRALEREPRLRDLEHRDVTLALRGSELTLEGELPSIPAKTRALHVAHGFKQLRRVVDHLLVEPAVQMKDAHMRDLLVNELEDEPAFRDFRLVARAGGDEVVVHDPVYPQGTLIASIVGGVVTLEGKLPSLVHRRIAKLLSWWVPGTRDVRDELETPREDDSDEEINDAVLVALERDPLIDGDQVAAATRDHCVTLAGTLPSEEQRRLAERDAWYIDGVLDVDNQIAVQVR